MSINWNAPRYVETNGIRMAVYEQGAGVPVVMSHGFPELAFSWRHQIPALAAAGFHAIAPDQRGYGLTDRPQAVESYDIHHLTGDLVGLLDALKIEKAVFVGHDWGGIVTWAMPLLHPHRVLGVVGVNTPFLPRAPMDPIALMRAAYGENPFGSGCLLARRLVEHGVRYVEVVSDGWDTHADNFDRLGDLTPAIDQGLSALLADLDARGLLRDTVVVLATEFGRTPDIDQDHGRNHYPKAFSCLLAGGGAD